MQSMGRRLEDSLKEDRIVFLTYGGFLTQTLLVALTEVLEKGLENPDVSKKTSINIFTIFIELSQNIMHYSKEKEDEGASFDPKGMVVVGQNSDGEYYVFSQNEVSRKDKERIEPRLLEVASSDKETIKKLYRESRRSGKHSHSKGGGIGFYEIAKRSKSVQYEFVALDDDMFSFRFKATLD